MDNVLFGILNYNRSTKNVDKIIQRLPVQKKDVMVVSNNQGENYVPVGKNVAESKNKILLEAQKRNVGYCFILEDDILATDTFIFKAYISLMDRFGLNVIMYGYDNANRVLNGKINPCMILKLLDGQEIYLNRNVCSSVMAFKMYTDMVLFDERLNCLETEFLLTDMVARGKYPFNGFFIDIPNSVGYFRKLEKERVKDKSIEAIQKDIQTRGEKINLHTNADDVINYFLNRS